MGSIGNIISKQRKLKALTQEELAELSNVNLRTIQRIENNENEPRGKTLSLICDVLNLDLEELLIQDRSIKSQKYGIVIINYLFLVVVNLAMMGAFGYLTLGSEGSLSSKFGGVLLSIFLPFFIVCLTKTMSGIERMIKFGSGFVIYIILVFYKPGFSIGFISGLFICLPIALGILFYGNKILNQK